MSRVTDNWVRLRTRFQATTGYTPLLAIGAITNKQVITGTPGTDYAPVWGALANSTTFEIQALASDFPTDPMKGTLAVVTASAQGTITRQVLSSVRRDGIVYFTVGDASA